MIYRRTQLMVLKEQEMLAGTEIRTQQSSLTWIVFQEVIQTLYQVLLRLVHAAQVTIRLTFGLRFPSQ